MWVRLSSRYQIPAGPSPTMLLPDIIAKNSETKPDAPFYVFASPHPSTDIVTITHLEFAWATHRAAQLVRPNREDADGEVVAVLALADTIVYHAAVAGLMTAKCIPFPICQWLSAPAAAQLLRKSSCHRLLTTSVTLAPLLRGIQDELRHSDPGFVLAIEELPSLSQLYPNLGSETNSGCPVYVSTADETSLDDIGLYLHSSGTTGFPKPIAHTHRTLLHWSRFAFVTDIHHYITSPFAIGTMGLLPFALSGLFCQLLQPLYGGVIVAVFPPTTSSSEMVPIQASPDNILQFARKTNCKSVLTVPTLLAVWAKSPESIAYLKTLNLVLFGGGLLPKPLGDKLVNSGVNLRALYAGTEFGAISALIPLPGDEQEWEWLRFTDQVRVRWVPKGGDIFECQILTWENHQVSAQNLEDVKGYATSDLWVRHPDKEHLWKLIGRLDDVIVLLSGEMITPALMEDTVVSSPHVAAAVMFGHGQEKPGILIQPTPTLQVDAKNPTVVSELRNKIWSIVVEANETAPAFSRIQKDMIMFASPDKPLPRTVIKATVSRTAAVNLYAQEIAAMYK
ncbi:hypothetical protein B0H11DRAFT_2060762 [Mycena galericulata]|nr:hypothetical protein B0H11DRAFT_2060762 [Mycena galericulata]